MDFNKVINRKNTYCTQWDYIEDRFGEGSKDYTPFSISDTDFKVPSEISDAISKRVSHGVFGYSRWNHDDFKKSIENWYLKRYKTSINKDWVIYSPSVLYSISLILRLTVGVKGKVMTHTPRYDGFTKLLKQFDLTEIRLIEDSDGIFKTDFEQIELGFKNGVKAFLLCNPENPVGKVWKKSELQKLIDLCIKYKVLLVSDDIHMDITRDEVTPVLQLDTENSVIFSSASKTFNIASLGGSYGIIPNNDLRDKFVAHMKEVDFVSSPPILGVIATMTAYNSCDYWVDELNSYLLKNCEFVVKNLNNYKGLKVSIPEATYLMWINFEGCKIDPSEFKKALLSVGHVAIMSGDNYGDPYKIRLNVGAPLSKVEVGVEGIKRALDYLKK